MISTFLFNCEERRNAAFQTADFRSDRKLVMQLQMNLATYVEMMHAYHLICTPYIVFLPANCNISFYKYHKIIICCY